MNHLMRWSTLPGLLALAGCLLGCPGGGCTRPPLPPDQVTRTLEPFTLTVNAGTGTITVAQGSLELALLHVSDVGVGTGRASYEMQYGMFDVQESAGDWQVPTQLEITDNALLGIGDIAFALKAADGTELVRGSVGATSEGKATITLGARGLHNRVRAAVACQPTDHFNGLGAQTHDVDHRGQHVPLWVSEQGIGKTDDDALPVVWQLTGRRHSTHIPIPAVVVSRGTAWLMDTTAFGDGPVRCAGRQGAV